MRDFMQRVQDTTIGTKFREEWYGLQFAVKEITKILQKKFPKPGDPVMLAVWRKRYIEASERCSTFLDYTQTRYNWPPDAAAATAYLYEPPARQPRKAP